jgi:hypothetical protein
MVREAGAQTLARRNDGRRRAIQQAAARILNAVCRGDLLSAGRLGASLSEEHHELVRKGVKCENGRSSEGKSIDRLPR